MKSNFINVKLDSKKGNESELRKKFNVPGYPTVILFNSEGNEIDRIIGFDNDADKFFKTILDFVEGKNTITSILAKWQSDSSNVDLTYKLAQKYLGRYEQELAQKYIIKTLQLDPEDIKGYREDCLFSSATYAMYHEDNLEKMNRFMDSNPSKEFQLKAYDNLIRFYSSNGKKSKVLETYKKTLELSPESTDLMNGYGWYVYENKIVDKYEESIKLTKKAVEIDPKADGIWDTLAWLYYENGNMELAINAMEKALEILPDSKYYLKNIKKFKSEKG